ncbi:MAG: DUF4003 domain-containing protein [Defluviitaleaceae bacterium]|nr:DUF4003 domain-containing protein [Defluviitaleaceae bacterium]MCL2273893.1 DUF4003 domain-containing protein [Defluviitaleaceae bacterium]
MNRELENRLTHFVKNTHSIKSSFPWQEMMIKRLAALIFTMEGRDMNAPAVVKTHKLLKDETGIFSTFRGNLSVLIAAMASTADNPRARIMDTLHVYDLLKAEKFRFSDYLVAAAYEIASQAKEADYATIVHNTREIFLAMRANNRFLIDADDYIYAAMLALAGFDSATASDRVKHMYADLRADFPFTVSRSCLLHLAQIMVLSDRTNHCVPNLVHMNRVLRSHKVKLDRAMVLPSLGILSMLPVDPDSLANEIISVVNFLRTQKGFGAFSVMQAEANMMATALISTTHLAQSTTTTAITNMLIAQQTAMMTAIIVANSVAVSSAASASGGC